MKKEDIMICRCEDVTLAELHHVLEEGYRDFETIKRLIRVGMGPCQGNTCGLLVQREIARYTNQKIDDIPTQKVRPLISGVKMKSILEAYNNER